MKLFTVVLALIAIVVPVASFAQLPVCRLGGPTAMDTNRELAEGEAFTTTDRPLVVNLRFKPTKEHPEQVGECMLASGEKVAVKNGILMWVAKCGNDEVNRNIVVGSPTPIADAIRGIQGPEGPQGPPGVQGEPGFNGNDGKDAPVVKHGHKKLWVTIAAIVVGGTVYALTKGDSKPKGPAETTLPICTALPCR